jgi:hypothetical protein
MPLSAKSLHAAGRISDRQMTKLAALRGTRSQKSKMAPFDSKSKAEGAVGNKGILGKGEINSSRHQDKGGTWGTSGRSPPSKGGRAGPEGQLQPRKQIDQGNKQRPKFPPGGDVKASNPKGPPARARKAPIQRAGNVYDEPDRNGAR